MVCEKEVGNRKDGGETVPDTRRRLERDGATRRNMGATTGRLALPRGNMTVSIPPKSQGGEGQDAAGFITSAGRIEAIRGNGIKSDGVFQ